MITPPYFHQESNATCSLAVLRMALAHFGIKASENELKAQVILLYGKRFKNIWNSTIARIACEYGLKVHFEALWPLLKPEQFKKAFSEYQSNKENQFKVDRYENPNDTHVSSEPLPLSYAELFAAQQAGCSIAFGGATIDALAKAFSQGKLILLTIKRERLYPKLKPAFHSILVFAVQKDLVFYHDPFYGESLSVSQENLMLSLPQVKPMIVFGKMAK